MLILRSARIKMAADLTRRETAVTCLQCHFRGYTVRSKLKQVQKEFGEIVHELDGQDFHVVWPSKKQVLSFPLLITNEEKTQDNNSLSLPDENDNNHVEPGGVDEDRTLTQDVCDKIDDISALYPSTDNQETLARDTSEIPGNFVSDSVKRKLEQNFDETFLGEEKKPTHTVKTGSIDNNMNHPGLGEDNEIRTQQEHEIMTSDSPHPDDKQMYTQHSTPVSSGDTETTDRVTSRRHPLLTDSWMTDKSFDALSDDTTISDKDLQEKREQIAMELLWTQQAIESRKNIEEEHDKYRQRFLMKIMETRRQ